VSARACDAERILQIGKYRPSDVNQSQVFLLLLSMKNRGSTIKQKRTQDGGREGGEKSWWKSSESIAADLFYVTQPSHRGGRGWGTTCQHRGVKVGRGSGKIGLALPIRAITALKPSAGKSDAYARKKGRGITRQLLKVGCQGRQQFRTARTWPDRKMSCMVSCYDHHPNLLGPQLARRPVGTVWQATPAG